MAVADLQRDGDRRLRLPGRNVVTAEAELGIVCPSFSVSEEVGVVLGAEGVSGRPDLLCLISIHGLGACV